MSRNARHRRVVAAALALLPCLLIAVGCGETSKTTSSPASASATAGGSTASTQTSTSAQGSTTSTQRDTGKATPKEIATGEAILANYRACLAKYGVDLPVSKIGEPIRQPKGVSSQQYTAARQKCLPVLSGQVPVSTAGGKTTHGTPGQSGKVKIPKGTHSVTPTNPGGTVSVPSGTGAITTNGHKRTTKVSAHALAGLKNFAACMRENGINVPTPTKARPFFVPKGVDTKGSQFLAAETKCLPRLSAH